MEGVELYRQSVLRAQFAKSAPVAVHPRPPSTPTKNTVDASPIVNVPINTGQETDTARIERKLDTLINMLKGLDTTDLPVGEERARYLTGKGIKRIVCAYFDLTEQDLDRPVHLAQLARARQIGFYLCRHQTMKSLPEIGRLFKRDHSTVLHGIRRIETQRVTNPDLNCDLTHLEARIAAVLAQRAAV